MLRALRISLETAVIVVFALLVWSNFSLRRQQLRAAAAPRMHRGFAPRDRIAQVPVVDASGHRTVLDLQKGRKTVAIVDPRCDSCRELLATVAGSDVEVIALSPLRGALTLGGRLPGALDVQMHVYPQLFVVDRGEVVRTCASLAECR